MRDREARDALGRIRRKATTRHSSTLLRHLRDAAKGKSPLWSNQAMEHLLQEAMGDDEGYSLWWARRTATEKWFWPLPTREPIEAIRQACGERTLISPMQGKGYIEALILRSGLPQAQLRTSDLRNGRPGGIDREGSGMDAEQAVKLHGLETQAMLLLSWPPNQSNAALRALRAFRGDRLAYWGEPEEGCCAEAGFFQEIRENWRVIKSPPSCSWPGIHDRLWIYENARRPDLDPDLDQ